MNEILKYGSLFTGGAGLDLGLEKAGLICAWMVENDKNCLKILNREWPHVPKNELGPGLGLVGGDPCPVRSRASAIFGTDSPDMSGYFLAMVARREPRWILRENVPSPDVVDFAVALTVLGYSPVCIELSAKAFTSQLRRREFIVSFRKKSAAERFEGIFIRQSLERLGQAGRRNKTPANSITTRGKWRNTYSENYVFEKRKGIRVFTHKERETIQGFPSGWTRGLSHAARERITGNAVTVPVAEFLGKAIFQTLKPS